MDNMKCAIVILYVLTCANFSEQKWCTKDETSTIEVLATRTKFKPDWISIMKGVVEYYTVKEPLVITKQKRVCCDGYILRDLGESTACLPECDSDCPLNSECVEPNRCECQQGYHMQDGLCRLDCGNCDNGECTDLGQCVCKPRYVRIQDTCKPICSRKCVNGFCAAPNLCMCKPGYVETWETNRCDSSCGELCGENAYCSKPGVCSCKYGFFGNATDACQPWCKVECKNGDCIGPNNCACHQGFEKIDGLCIPDCQSGCRHGDCIDEGVCKCWDGFVYNNSSRSCHIEETTTTESTGTSQPVICLNDCGSGICVAGVCHCQEGFINANSSCLCAECKIGNCVNESMCLGTKTSSEEPLSSTSESSTSSTTEIPMKNVTSCNFGCWDGTCIDGVCQCPIDLILNADNDCVKPCEATCNNGFCSQNHVCECYDGYVHKNVTECIPACERECVNGFCIAPNHCECNEGYIANWDPLLAHVCLPTCNGSDGDDGCSNGTCIAVNKCQCLEDYIQSSQNRFECIPSAEKHQRQQGFFWIVYLLVGALILLVSTILGLYVLRKFHQDSYNVYKVEKSLGTVLYRNEEEQFCTI